MRHYICYLKGKKENIDIISLLSNILNCKKELIGDFFEYGDFKIRFENRFLDDRSEFNTELNVYINEHISKSFSNNCSFGLEASRFLNEEILVNTKNDYSYEWILINNNLCFIVEETDGDHNGITLEKSTNIRISGNEAIEIFT